ncbi:hypothetical protein Tco_0940387 [Tanacetum coccineum]|uniref:Uncharacterized protein n=1 Tax=Tanacetum coccineum TaxID=301880 RepID=A0ABQ5DNM4_9ASTR
MAIPCGCVGFRIVRFLDVMGSQPRGESSAHTATISPIEETSSQTEGEKAKIETEEKEIADANVEKELETKPIPITIVRPTTKPTHETKIIGSSSRPQLTDSILEVQVPHPESSHATPKPDRGKGITRNTDEPPRKLVPASTKVRQDPNAPVLVVHEEATKAGVDPKALSSKKGGLEFLKIQDAKMNILKIESLEKLTKAKELGKKRIDQYRWTTTSRLKPEIIYFYTSKH